MKKHPIPLAAAALSAGMLSGSALADPPAGNEHNCAGAVSSSLVPPGFGPLVGGLAQLFPTAVPTTFDFANCGGNGFPPGA